MKAKYRKNFIIALSTLIIFLLWYIISVTINTEIIIPQPKSVLKELIKLFTKPEFLKSIISTVKRAMLSGLIIVFSGSICGIIAGKYNWFRFALKPIITILKSTPVMSLILIAYFWFSASKIPVFSAFVMVFPIMYIQILNGMDHLDKDLNEVCQIYQVQGIEKLKCFILPSLVPDFITGAKQTLAMVWKIVIAAEVLTIPEIGIGRQLQLAQMQLLTAQVFAWTIVVITLTSISDYIFHIIIRFLKSRYDCNSSFASLADL